MKRLFILWQFANSLYATAQPPPVYVPTNSLSGWYSFTGNANDLSGNGNHGIIYGATLTSDAGGVLNSAYMFTPNNKIVTPIRPQSMVSGASVPVSAALFTSFNANTLGTSLGSSGLDGLGHCLISSDSAGYGGIALGVVNGSLTACVGVHWMRKAFQFTPGAWYHVGLNFNAASQLAELFVNAVSIGTVAVLPPFQNVSPSLYQMGFISNPGTWNVPFNGKMDEAGIWNRSLSLCEITQLYNKSLFSASLQPQSQTANVGNTVYFTTGSAFINTTYQWQENSGSGFVNITNNFPFNGTNSATLTVSSVTNQYNNYLYRCVLTSAACSFTTNSALLNVSTATGFNHLSQDVFESAGFLFPNPTRGVINFTSSGKTNTKIFNGLGKIVYASLSEEGLHQIDLSDQPEGLYFVQTGEGDMVKVTKIIIGN